MSDVNIHLANLDGAYRLCRDAAVAEMRTFHPDFAAALHAHSHRVTSHAQALEHVSSAPGGFVIFPLGEDIETLRDGNDQLSRTRRQPYLFVLAQWSSDGTGEDLFFDRVELFENRWGAKETFEVTVGPLRIAFTVTLESASPLTVATDDNNIVVGHATTRRLILEVEACAS